MKKNTILIAALTAGLSTLALSSASLAQTIPPFNEVDHDDDDALNFGEVSFVYGGLTQAQFAAADVDGNGSLNESEFNSLATAGVSMSAPVGEGCGATVPMTPPDFKDADANSDGSVDLGEASFYYSGITQADLTMADADKNGSLNEGEFNSLATMNIATTSEAQVSGDAMAPTGPADFKTADANSDGSLDFGEASVQHDGLTQAQFSAADVDGNGTLNEGEYNSLAM